MDAENLARKIALLIEANKIDEACDVARSYALSFYENEIIGQQMMTEMKDRMDSIEGEELYRDFVLAMIEKLKIRVNACSI